MTYQKYQHIQKFGNTEVNGINQGTCYIFYKIDGTNGCVFGKEGNLELGFGSRNRELSDNSAESDNQRFVALMKSPEYQSVYNDLLRLIQENPDFIVYGEWLIPSTLKTYKDDAWRHFYVFDILNTKCGQLLKTLCDYGTTIGISSRGEGDLITEDILKNPILSLSKTL